MMTLNVFYFYPVSDVHTWAHNHRGVFSHTHTVTDTHSVVKWDTFDSVTGHS